MCTLRIPLYFLVIVACWLHVPSVSYSYKLLKCFIDFLVEDGDDKKQCTYKSCFTPPTFIIIKVCIDKISIFTIKVQNGKGDKSAIGRVVNVGYSDTVSGEIQKDSTIFKFLRWCSGDTAGHHTLRFIGHGFGSCTSTLHSGLRQTTYTCVTLSPSSITWYRSRGGDALRLGR